MLLFYLSKYVFYEGDYYYVTMADGVYIYCLLIKNKFVSICNNKNYCKKSCCFGCFLLANIRIYIWLQFFKYFRRINRALKKRQMTNLSFYDRRRVLHGFKKVVWNELRLNRPSDICQRQPVFFRRPLAYRWR